MAPPLPLPGTPERLALDLRAYAGRDDEQYALAMRLAVRARIGKAVFGRPSTGHFTASALVISADGQRMLLLLHAKIGKWLQPGGHSDGQPDLGRVAREEAEQETGLQGLLLDPNIFDLDCHPIAARTGEAAHEHWDVRYVLRATYDEQPRCNEESCAVEWRKVGEVARDATLDLSVRRLAVKWLYEANRSNS